MRNQYKVLAEKYEQVLEADQEPVMTVNKSGDKEWRLNGKLHRLDGPAIEWMDGHKAWYVNGLPHREDGPAFEFSNGSKHWYLNGKCHREDGPAVDGVNGDKCWFYQDKKIDCKDNKEFLRMIKLIVFI